MTPDRAAEGLHQSEAIPFMQPAGQDNMLRRPMTLQPRQSPWRRQERVDERAFFGKIVGVNADFYFRVRARPMKETWNDLFWKRHVLSSKRVYIRSQTK